MPVDAEGLRVGPLRATGARAVMVTPAHQVPTGSCRHRRRRDAMIEAIRAHLPDAVVHGAAAGLHLMITFPAAFADTDLAAAALARGVKVQPLSWPAQQPRGPGLILGYAATPPTAIAEAVAILGDQKGQLG